MANWRDQSASLFRLAFQCRQRQIHLPTSLGSARRGENFPRQREMRGESVDGSSNEAVLEKVSTS